MNNTIIFSKIFKRIYVGGLLIFICGFAYAQKTPSIKDVKTDNVYANTTEVNKSKYATDAQVLAEIEGNYGIGDIVRIVERPPVVVQKERPIVAPSPPVFTESKPSQQPTTPNLAAKTPGLAKNERPITATPRNPSTQQVPPQQPITPNLAAKTPAIDKSDRVAVATPIRKEESSIADKDAKFESDFAPHKTVQTAVTPSSNVSDLAPTQTQESIRVPITSSNDRDEIIPEQTSRVERKASSQTNSTYRSSSRSSVSKKSGFSFKKLSNLFKKSNYKKAKQRKVKRNQHNKCYKF